MKNIIFIVVVFLAACVNKKNEMMDKDQSGKTEIPPDVKVIDSINIGNIIQANNELIDILNVITEKTNDPKMKQVTKEMIDDHKNFNSELASEAQRMQIGAEEKIDNKKSIGAVNNLKNASYEEFQLDAISELKNRYNTMFDNLKYAQDETSDPELKNVMATHSAFMQKYLEFVNDSLGH